MRPTGDVVGELDHYFGSSWGPTCFARPKRLLFYVEELFYLVTDVFLLFATLYFVSCRGVHMCEGIFVHNCLKTDFYVFYMF